MLYLHCRIRVSDFEKFEKWKIKMEADRASQLQAGLNLKYLWQSIDDPNNAFMDLEVQDKEKTRQHLSPSDLKKSSDAAGVLERHQPSGQEPGFYEVQEERLAVFLSHHARAE